MARGVRSMSSSSASTLRVYLADACTKLRIGSFGTNVCSGSSPTLENVRPRMDIVCCALLPLLGRAVAGAAAAASCSLGPPRLVADCESRFFIELCVRPFVLRTCVSVLPVAPPACLQRPSSPRLSEPILGLLCGTRLLPVRCGDAGDDAGDALRADDVSDEMEDPDDDDEEEDEDKDCCECSDDDELDEMDSLPLSLAGPDDDSSDSFTLALLVLLPQLLLPLLLLLLVPLSTRSGAFSDSGDTMLPAPSRGGGCTRMLDGRRPVVPAAPLRSRWLCVLLLPWRWCLRAVLGVIGARFGSSCVVVSGGGAM